MEFDYMTKELADEVEKSVAQDRKEWVKPPIPETKSVVTPHVTSPGNVLPASHMAMPVEPGYEELARILAQAFKQAAQGKGRERHSKQAIGFQPWHSQPIMQMGRMVGPGGHAYQVQKKAQESVTMAGNANFAGAKAEALGAIVYAAALFKLYEEMESAHSR